MTQASREEFNSSSGRILEIFLDLLMALSTDTHSYLLAEGFEGALTDSKRFLRETLLDLGKRPTYGKPQSSGGTPPTGDAG